MKIFRVLYWIVFGPLIFLLAFWPYLAAWGVALLAYAYLKTLH